MISGANRTRITGPLTSVMVRAAGVMERPSTTPLRPTTPTLWMSLPPIAFRAGHRRHRGRCQRRSTRIIANKTGNQITSARIKSDIDDLDAYGYYEVQPLRSSALIRVGVHGQRFGCWATLPRIVRGPIPARSTWSSGVLTTSTRSPATG